MGLPLIWLTPSRWDGTDLLALRAWSQESRTAEPVCSRVGGCEASSQLSSSDSRWQETGPQLGLKLDRKPWLSKFIAKSTSRNPPKMPVSSRDQQAAEKPYRSVLGSTVFGSIPHTCTARWKLPI
eukprot:768056-Hanusia_phi.AAC.5